MRNTGCHHTDKRLYGYECKIVQRFWALVRLFKRQREICGYWRRRALCAEAEGRGLRMALVRAESVAVPAGESSVGARGPATV